jgi:hypothetical protein
VNVSQEKAREPIAAYRYKMKIQKTGTAGVTACCAGFIMHEHVFLHP